MKYFLTILVSFLILYLLGVSNVLIYIGVAILLSAGMIFLLLRATLWETNVEKIEKFLLRNKKNPDFYIIYALANKKDEDVKSITETLVQRTNKEPRKALYKIQEALHFDDYDAAKEVINDIEAPAYRHYYGSLLLLEDDHLDKANRLIEKVKTEWMYYALLAEREKKNDNLEKAKEHANKAKDHAKGLQKYILHKTYERELGI